MDLPRMRILSAVFLSAQTADRRPPASDLVGVDSPTSGGVTFSVFADLDVLPPEETSVNGPRARADHCQCRR